MSKKNKQAQPLTFLEKHELVSKYSTQEVPFQVWRMFGDSQKTIQLLGEDICLGEDYGSLEACREALEWYVDQLGGTVSWK